MVGKLSMAGCLVMGVDVPGGQRTTTANALPDQRPKDTSPTSLMSNLHLGALVFGAGSTVLVALRLISVARFNPETAYGILQASGTGNVIIGTVISLIPSIAIIVALSLILVRVLSRSPKTDPRAEFARWMLVFLLALIGLLTIPFKYVVYVGPGILVFLGFIVAILIIKIRAKRKGPASKTGETGSSKTGETGSSKTGETGSSKTGETGSSKTGETGSSKTGETGSSKTGETGSSKTGETGSWLQRDWGWTGTAFAIFSALLIALTVMFGVVFSPPWMPAERLTLNNNQTVPGYVLAQTSDGLTFMQANSREITHYNPGVVIDQAFCTNAPATDLPIIYYIKSITRLDLGKLGKYGHC